MRYRSGKIKVYEPYRCVSLTRVLVETVLALLDIHLLGVSWVDEERGVSRGRSQQKLW